MKPLIAMLAALTVTCPAVLAGDQPPPAALPYRMLCQMARELTEFRKDHDLGSVLKRPFVVHINTEAGAPSPSVTILARKGAIKLKPVEPGHVIIRFDAKLMEEDPWVMDHPRQRLVQQNSHGGGRHATAGGQVTTDGDVTSCIRKTNGPTD